MALTEVAQVSFPYISVILHSNFRLTWSASKNTSFGRSNKYDGPDYFMSLTVKRIKDKKSNVAKATTGTLTITYVPNSPSDNLNILEIELARSKLRFLYQYGYYDKGYNLICTDWYAALISKIKTSVDEGKLTYTIDFVAGSAAYAYAETKAYTIRNNTSAEITSVIQEIAETSLSANPNSIPFNWNYVYNYIKSDTDYKIKEEFLDNNGIFHLPANPNGGFAQISDLLLKLVPMGVPDHVTDVETQARLNAKLEDSKYVLIFQDESTDITDSDLGFYVKRIYGKTSTLKDYTFDWNTRDSRVLSWNPEYNAMIGIVGSVKNSNSVAGIGYFSVNKGIADIKFLDDIRFRGTYSTFINGDESLGYNTGEHQFLERAMVTQATYENYSQYNYSASMEVFGVIGELQMGETHIFVRPMINNQMHHTGGEYIVVGVTDTVGSNGFTTKMDLIKFTKNGEIEFTQQVTSIDQNIFADN